MKIITSASCTDYYRIGHPERPQRVAATLEKLRADAALGLTFVEAAPAKRDAVLAAHTPSHLARLAQPIDFDEDTPAYPGIERHALVSVGGALTALDSALAGDPAMSVVRPPGHHALADRAMGFCYLNQIAIAACSALARGLRVAVFDFDVHHGNGTEALLDGRSGTAFASVHQYPAYPGTGRASHGNCLNYPMPPWTPRTDYADTLKTAFDALLATRPDVIAVSAGFDAYRADPLAQEQLDLEDYAMLGDRLRESGIPAFAVLEGGYSDDLPDLVAAFLGGWSGKGD